jgi:chemotaxis protein MotB
VDGHTDKRPVNVQFRSNWELSAARAISVVQFLVSRGVSPQRLVAAGFGEFQPLDAGDTDEALRRNRRIELKLTER